MRNCFEITNLNFAYLSQDVPLTAKMSMKHDMLAVSVLLLNDVIAYLKHWCAIDIHNYSNKCSHQEKTGQNTIEDNKHESRRHNGAV